MSDRKRILTGIRPTGALHLGHYAGALENWVRLQHDYESYFLIADYQVSDYADDIARVRDSVWQVALDWLAVGLDPEGSSFFIEKPAWRIWLQAPEIPAQRRKPILARRGLAGPRLFVDEITEP